MKKWLRQGAALLAALTAVFALSACLDEEEDAFLDSPDASQSEEYDDTEDNESQEGVISHEDRQYGTGLIVSEPVAHLSDKPGAAMRRSIQFAPKQTYGTMLDGTSLTDEFYFYRNTLSKQHKKAYDQIRMALSQGSETINISVPVSADDIFNIYLGVVYDNPDMFWAEAGISYDYDGNGNVVALYPTYNDLVNDIAGNTAVFEDSVSKALADMWSMNEDIDRVKYAHDYLTHINDYVLDAPYNQTAYSALVGRQTVCAGYSRAFVYMMQKMGIPAAYVHGDGGGESHAWNILELYGEYYAMDITWDDPIGAGPNDYYYDFFCITDDELARNDHTRDSDCEALPWATGTQCSYQNAFGGNQYGTNFDAYNGDTPPSGSGQPSSSEPDEWYDPDDDYTDDSYGEYDYEWWSMLDSSWSIDDWYSEDGVVWTIWDDESQFWYIYDASVDSFWCMDQSGRYTYYLDMMSGEWIEDESSSSYIPDETYPSGNGYGYNFDYEWWSMLDSDWSLDDWSTETGDVWEIWDDETNYWYLYDAVSDIFWCYDDSGEYSFYLDIDSGEWIESDW